MDWNTVRAVVTRGHRVASGAGGDPRFPEGTIKPQLPFFERHVADFEAWLGGRPHPGTLNLAVDAGHVDILQPEHFLRDIPWTDAFPPENFYLSRCLVETSGERHPGWLYIPDPATKPDHPQRPDVVEVLAPLLPGIAYGAAVLLHYHPDAIAFRAA